MGSVVGALDLPSEADEPGRAEHTSDRGTDRATPREMPDPGERGRVYEAMRAHVSAETPTEAELERDPDRPDRRSYWAEVPRFLDMRADYQQRWPTDRQPAAECSADPAGSYRSHGGFYLSPTRHVEAVAAIGRLHEAEPMISAGVRRVEQENRNGGRLEGFKFRLKGDDRLKEKVAAQLVIEPDKPPSEVLRKVPDGIRYTFCLEAENFTEGYYEIKDRLEREGYEMFYSKNEWRNPEYKGVNTRWVTTEGNRFEIQFHTRESFHAKQYVTHDAYERIRNPFTRDEEREELEDFQREVSSWVEVPKDAHDIPDFKKEGL
jgi:hypothetical protein